MNSPTGILPPLPANPDDAARRNPSVGKLGQSRAPAKVPSAAGPKERPAWGEARRNLAVPPAYDRNAKNGTMANWKTIVSGKSRSMAPGAQEKRLRRRAG